MSAERIRKIRDRRRTQNSSLFDRRFDERRLSLRSFRSVENSSRNFLNEFFLVIFHQMKRSCAQRLAEAIRQNKTDVIFRPDEQILNETFYIDCPLRTSQTICWKTPIATRHLGQHLTGIHKLDRNERRKVLASLRKSS